MTSDCLWTFKEKVPQSRQLNLLRYCKHDTVKRKAESGKEKNKPEKTEWERTAEPSSDLQHHHEEKVEVGHSLELFKQCHGQENQEGVLVAAHQIVLATVKKRNTEKGTRDT